MIKYNFVVLLFVWIKFLGVYESDVKMYFYGVLVDLIFWYVFGVFDNNMFVIVWVMICFLEVYKYGKVFKLMVQMLDLLINFIMDYCNKNFNYINLIMVFWLQFYNEKVKVQYEVFLLMRLGVVVILKCFYFYIKKIFILMFYNFYIVLKLFFERNGYDGIEVLFKELIDGN